MTSKTFKEQGKARIELKHDSAIYIGEVIYFTEDDGRGWIYKNQLTSMMDLRQKNPLYNQISQVFRTTTKPSQKRATPLIIIYFDQLFKLEKRINCWVDIYILGENTSILLPIKHKTTFSSQNQNNQGTNTIIDLSLSPINTQTGNMQPEIFTLSPITTLTLTPTLTPTQNQSITANKTDQGLTGINKEKIKETEKIVSEKFDQIYTKQLLLEAILLDHGGKLDLISHGLNNEQILLELKNTKIEVLKYKEKLKKSSSLFMKFQSRIKNTPFYTKIQQIPELLSIEQQLVEESLNNLIE